MRKPTRVLAVALCAVLLLLAGGQSVLAATHAHHDHGPAHDHLDCRDALHCCVVCTILHGLQTLLRAIALVLAGFLVLATGLLFPLFPAPRAVKFTVPQTLISLRVRLNP